MKPESVKRTAEWERDSANSFSRPFHGRYQIHRFPSDESLAVVGRPLRGLSYSGLNRNPTCIGIHQNNG